MAEQWQFRERRMPGQIDIVIGGPVDPYTEFLDVDADGTVIHYAVAEFQDELMHYGTPRHSGRYPWGSGENPYQRYANFKGNVERLRAKGLSDTEIARSMNMTTSVMRAKISI